MGSICTWITGANPPRVPPRLAIVRHGNPAFDEAGTGSPADEASNNPRVVYEYDYMQPVPLALQGRGPIPPRVQLTVQLADVTTDDLSSRVMNLLDAHRDDVSTDSMPMRVRLVDAQQYDLTTSEATPAGVRPADTAAYMLASASRPAVHPSSAARRSIKLAWDPLLYAIHHYETPKPRTQNGGYEMPAPLTVARPPSPCVLPPPIVLLERHPTIRSRGCGFRILVGLLLGVLALVIMAVWLVVTKPAAAGPDETEHQQNETKVLEEEPRVPGATTLVGRTSTASEPVLTTELLASTGRPSSSTLADTATVALSSGFTTTTTTSPTTTITTTTTTPTTTTTTTTSTSTTTGTTTVTCPSSPAVITSIPGYPSLGSKGLTSVIFCGVSSVDVHLSLQRNSLTSISFQTVTRFNGDLYLFRNSLTRIDFGIVTFIAGDLDLENNQFTAISFGSLVAIGGGLYLKGNHLPIITFGSIAIVSGGVALANNTLTSITFDSLTSIGDYLDLSNNKLVTIAFPPALSVGGTIYVCNNPASSSLLSSCTARFDANCHQSTGC